MADLIQKTDSLNDGRVKLNEAITQAEQAEFDASKAKVDAGKALTEAVSLRTELDTIVIDGDSSVEAAQARVSTNGAVYTTLKERLDVEYNEIQVQLDDKASQESLTNGLGDKVDSVDYEQDKQNLVENISTNTHNLGNLSSLLTADKSTVVQAINEVYGRGNIIADNLKNKKIEVVAGTIRQNSSDPTKWEFISDGTHVPVGVINQAMNASGDGVVIPFSKTYSRVIAFVAGPDETFAERFGFSVGASVSLNSAFLKASANIKTFGTAHFDGSGTIIRPGVGSGNIGNATYVTSTGTMTIPHGYNPGTLINLSTFFSRSNATSYFIPTLYQVNSDSFMVRFIDVETGLYHTGALSTKMAFTFERTYSGKIPWDGSNGSSALNLSGGNIWFLGIFEV